MLILAIVTFYIGLMTGVMRYLSKLKKITQKFRLSCNLHATNKMRKYPKDDINRSAYDRE